MNRLENRRALSDRSGRQQAHRAADARTLIRQDITKRILGYHHVEEFRLLDHTHSGVVHIHIVCRYFRIARSHLLSDLAP